MESAVPMDFKINRMDRKSVHPTKLIKSNKKSAKICEICVKIFNFLKKFNKICKKLACGELVEPRIWLISDI